MNTSLFQEGAYITFFLTLIPYFFSRTPFKIRKYLILKENSKENNTGGKVFESKILEAKILEADLDRELNKQFSDSPQFKLLRDLEDLEEYVPQGIPENNGQASDQASDQANTQATTFNLKQEGDEMIERLKRTFYKAEYKKSYPKNMIYTILAFFTFIVLGIFIGFIVTLFHVLTVVLTAMIKLDQIVGFPIFGLITVLGSLFLLSTGIIELSYFLYELLVQYDYTITLPFSDN